MVFILTREFFFATGIRVFCGGDRCGRGAGGGGSRLQSGTCVA